ncbi:NAD(P)/FAD-dependent oxidoreductase [Rhodococcus sp. NPDC059234]|uniref:NAD(P)/FAD-dependent oxidoreductase n=1 Tax=Rhodococcus sp. NPDC059234 TaxID=3346781 RepID=UPI0036708A1F
MTKTNIDRMPTEPVHRVVVVGAGYAGVLAANRLLSSLANSAGEGGGVPCSVTVVNPRPDFIERIRLHEVAAGTRATAATPLRQVLHPDAALVVGKVALIDPDEHLVEVVVDRTVADRRVQSIHYDTLVYAVGSTADHSVPGVDEHAYRVADVDSAGALQSAIAALADKARVRIVGGGLTAVETAGEIAAANPRLDVEIVCGGTILGFMRESARRRVTATLSKLGVTWREDTQVTEVTKDAITTTGGERLEFDVCVWTASFAVPDLAFTSGLATDAAGRLRVDETLTSIDHPDIIGAGDAVVLPSDAYPYLRMGCAMALPLGGHAAATILARLRGQQPEPLSVGFVAQCISIGRKYGYIQFVRADDSPRPLALSGRMGARFKEAICSMTLNSLIKEQTRPGAYKAPKGPKAAAPTGDDRVRR